MLMCFSTVRPGCGKGKRFDSLTALTAEILANSRPGLCGAMRSGDQGAGAPPAA